MTEDTISHSPEETESAGRRLAVGLTGSDVVYLVGELGAGKTCFARGLASGLGAPAEEVASPTFAIVHEYAAPDGALVLRHVDLYRVRDTARELEILGIPEALAGAPLAVEWPGGTLRGILPPSIEVTIERLADGARRISVLRTGDG